MIVTILASCDCMHIKTEWSSASALVALYIETFLKMHSTTVTRLLFYFVWTLFLTPPVIETINLIDHQVTQLSRTKRNLQDEKVDSPWEDVLTRSDLTNSFEKSNENTRKMLNDVDKSDEETRRAATSLENISDGATRRAAVDSSQDHSNEETRRATSSTNTESAEHVRRFFRKRYESDSDESSRSSSNEETSERTNFWQNIVNTAIQNALQPKASRFKGSRRAVDQSTSEDHSDEDTRRALASLESSSDEKSNESTTKAAISLEETTTEGTRRHADNLQGVFDEEGTTKKSTMDSEGIPDDGTRRFQKIENVNHNANDNVNTNINSNVQIDGMDFLPDEEFQPHYHPGADSNQHISDDILEKLRTCDIFRDNIIFVMGYLLRLPDGQLSTKEYSSLEMIYNAMKAKSIYIYNTLPLLSRLRRRDSIEQFNMVLKAISRNLPLYMKSAATFWIRRLNERKLNFGLFLAQIPETNILTGIPDTSLAMSKRRSNYEEMGAYDDGSKLTVELMGPIYVKIFHVLGIRKGEFSQPIFGTIIRDLPNVNGDPVFDEYAKYVSEESWNNKIPNWSEHSIHYDASDPYKLVESLINNICADEAVSLKMKKALLYIRHHFINCGGQKYLQTTVKDTRAITENGLNIDMLLKVVIPFHTDDIDEMKFRLRGYLLPTPNKEVLHIIDGINRFKYNTPTELLLGFLARLQMRLPPDNDTQIVASALLSNFLFPTAIQDISIPENGAIAFWVIIDSIADPEMNATIKSLVGTLQTRLFHDLKTWDNIQSQLLPTRHECTYPRKCLLIILQKFKAILQKSPTLFPKQVENETNELENYVTSSIDEKNSPRPCYDSSIPMASLLMGMKHVKTIKPTKSTTKRPIKSPKSSSKVFETIQVTKNSNKSRYITTELPKITTKLPKKNTTLPRINLKTLKKSAKTSKTTIYRSGTTSSTKTTTHPSTLTPKVSESAFKFRKAVTKLTTTSKPPAKTNKPKEISSTPSKSKVLQVKPYNTTTLIKMKKNDNSTGSMAAINHSKMKITGSGTTSHLSVNNQKSVVLPNINVENCVTIDFKAENYESLPSIYTEKNVSNFSSTAVIFPSISQLHKSITKDQGLVSGIKQVCVEKFTREIIQKLNRTIGASYESELLGKNWRLNYPTRIAVLMDILERALKHPKVISLLSLRKIIERYRNGLQFIGPYVYLPMLSHWKKLNADIIWSSIDLKNSDFSVIANAPPSEVEKNIVTLPLINPIKWIVPVKKENGDPLLSLLPRLPLSNQYTKKLKPLLDIFTQNKFKSTTGRSIDLSKSPNRGTLLLHTLIRLKYHRVIQKDIQLFKLIKLYLNILQRPAMYIKIPQEVITGGESATRGGWAVDTADLLELLPKPKSPTDTKLYETMRSLLSKPNLLTELKIPTPPMNTTKGSFMEIIIDKSLHNTDIKKNESMRTALKYYQDKFDSKNRGRMNLGWIWSQKFIVSTELHLGELIEKLLPYKQLSPPDKIAYDDLVKYFRDHPHFLNTRSLPLAEYKTRGAFVRGFFEHLLKESTLDKKVKENVKKLLPSVKLTGEGARSMPPLARRAVPIVQPTWR